MLFVLGNIIFPIWLLWLFPFIFVPAMILNLIIDTSVVAWGLHSNGITPKKRIIKLIWWRVWLTGLIVDLIVTGVLFALLLITDNFESSIRRDLQYGLSWNFFANPYAFILGATLLVFAGFLIYTFNKRLVFNRLDLEPSAVHSICLRLAVLTTPYFLFTPTGLFY